MYFSLPLSAIVTFTDDTATCTFLGAKHMHLIYLCYVCVFVCSYISYNGVKKKRYIYYHHHHHHHLSRRRSCVTFVYLCWQLCCLTVPYFHHFYELEEGGVYFCGWMHISILQRIIYSLAYDMNFSQIRLCFVRRLRSANVI